MGNLLAAITGSVPSAQNVLNATKILRPLLVQNVPADALSNIWACTDPVVATPLEGRLALALASFGELRSNLDLSIAALQNILQQAVAIGLQPAEVANIGGNQTTWSNTGNWDFGTLGNIYDTATMKARLVSHDNFGQINNGSGLYGASMMAFDAESAIPVNSFSLPPQFNQMQPVDPGGSYAYRTFTSDSMICNVRSLNGPGTGFGPAYTHTGGCGSFMLNYSLPTGGSHLGQDLVFEARMRFKSTYSADGNPAHAGFTPYYWSAMWTVGGYWDGGPEMDVFESYADTPESGLRNGNAFHCNSVGGTDQRFSPSDSWWVGMTASGMPGVTDFGPQQLTNWHTWTWYYAKDNTYKVYCDGYLFQLGTLVWEVPQGDHQGESPPMYFIFDFGAGHTQIYPINEYTVSAADLPMQYEISYARIFLRP